jgi:hypothetical protein
MYEHVAHRASFNAISDKLKEYFCVSVSGPDVFLMKRVLSRYYEVTYKRLLERIAVGGLVHIDETAVCLKDGTKGYVWVLTNLEQVVFLYRSTGEIGFLAEALAGFRGVAVTDFYPAYDTLQCAQQKCLVHLMRDFNHDLQGNPFDEELKSLASAFGVLLRTLVTSVDRYGLRKRHLNKHRKDVQRFFAWLAGIDFRSEMAETYRKRLLKFSDKLFTFIDYDGVPWNNNNAEHAIKRFAYYREVADGLFTKKSLSEHLILLSVYQTCKHKGIGFLQFMLSREVDVDAFGKRRRTVAGLPLLDLLPEGFTYVRRKPKRGPSLEPRGENSQSGSDTPG